MWVCECGLKCRESEAICPACNLREKQELRAALVEITEARREANPSWATFETEAEFIEHLRGIARRALSAAGGSAA